MRENSLFSTEGMTKSDRILHTPGGFAKKNLLYVQEVGRLQSLKPHRCIREKLDSFLFLIVLEGKGCLEAAGKKYELQSGDCALIDCMEHYEHISDEIEAWKLAWVHFNGVVAREYYDLFISYNKNNVFDGKDLESWNTLIGELLEKQSDRCFLTELECGELLLRMVNRVVSTVADSTLPTDGAEKMLAQNVREYLNESYADRMVIDRLEEDLDSSAEILNQGFRRFFGISIEDYVNSRRLNAAKEMLRFSIKPVEEIAVEVGLTDVEALQQTLRVNEGMSAEEYRMKWAQWVR